MKLWHCGGARSLRPLWTLEELGLDYELEVLPFPPRVMQPDYLKVNSLGTVPYFVDGDTVMTESVGICQYLVDRYEDRGLGLRPEHPDYGAYLNWLHHSDATLTFPQTIALRYYFFEPDPAKRAVADDYAKWFRAPPAAPR
jgi:glutathione S-transferase